MESQEAPSTPRPVPAGAKRRLGLILTAVGAMGLAGVAFWWMGYAHKAGAFSGSSDSLRQTVIVPTLDTPFPSGKNVIWCSSFQLAWNEIRDKVVGAPLTVVGAEEVATRLNTASQSASDLEPGTFYAASGRVNDGIVNKIKKDMATKFPSHIPPNFAQDAQEPDGILAYSYLAASVPFPHPFQQAQVAFGNSRGRKTKVEAFGVWGYGAQYEEIRRQVGILFCELARSWRQVKECAVDLCKDSHLFSLPSPAGSLQARNAVIVSHALSPTTGGPLAVS
jgi:hypothetical protein